MHKLLDNQVTLWFVGLSVAFAIPGTVRVAEAIDLGPAPVVLTLDVAPNATDWSTGLGLVGSSQTASTVSELDELLATRDVSSIRAGLGTSGHFPTTPSDRPRFNTTAQTLQTSPTGNAASLLMATLNNVSSHTITNLAVSYYLSEATDMDLGPFIAEQIAGHVVYYSTTGVADSWTQLGNFSELGQVSFSISSSLASFGPGPLYLLWVDDNAVNTGGAIDAGYLIDNITFTPTLGDLLPPFFGYVIADQVQSFEAVGSGLRFNNAMVGEVVTLAGTSALQVNNSRLDARTELVDLRPVETGSVVKVGVDVKAWESNAGSDFEDDDRIAVIAEYSSDAETFLEMTLVDLRGVTRNAGTIPPHDPNVADPADEIRATLGPTEPQNNADEPFKHFEVTLPADAKTVRVRVIVDIDSIGEFAAIDNITVTTAIVPEPASIWLLTIGAVAGCTAVWSRRNASGMVLDVPQKIDSGLTNP